MTAPREEAAPDTGAVGSGQAIGLAETLLKLCNDCLPISDDDASAMADWINVAETQMRFAADAIASLEAKLAEETERGRQDFEASEEHRLARLELEAQVAALKESLRVAEEETERKVREAVEDERDRLYLRTAQEMRGLVGGGVHYGVVSARLNWLAAQGAVFPVDRSASRALASAETSLKQEDSDA